MNRMNPPAAQPSAVAPGTFVLHLGPHGHELHLVVRQRPDGRYTLCRAGQPGDDPGADRTADFEWTAFSTVPEWRVPQQAREWRRRAFPELARQREEDEAAGFRSDWRPGDGPVAVGTVVDYHGSRTHGRYEVTARREAQDNPDLDLLESQVLIYCPDGYCYDLWPVDTPHKFGLRHLGVFNARRESFTVVAPPLFS